MPGDGDLNSDDYVAKLLAEDAKRSSLKYATAGLSAFLPTSSRRPGPKLNTRFLNHLVRDVDSHNSALKRKEEQDTQARIEGYRKREREDERARALDLAYTRRRKYREYSDDDRQPSRKRHRRSPSVDRERKEGRHRSHRRRGEARHELSESEDERPRSKSIRDHKHDKRSRHDEDYPRRRRTSSSRPESKRDDRKIPEGDRSPSLNTAVSRHDKTSARSDKSRPLNHGPRSDSDPLEALGGPLPSSLTTMTNGATIRPRGRGAQSSHHPATSSIDAHFSSTYDPNLDTGGTDFDETDDWDLALSALRDCTAWKQKQSDRLREAGFSEDDIRKWERSSTAVPGQEVGGDIGDVKWVKKGEDREWDLGKRPVMENDEEDGSGVSHTGKSRVEHPRMTEHVSTSRDGWNSKNGGLLKRFTSSLKHQRHWLSSL